MNTIDVFEISERVLNRLSKMDYEKTGGDSTEQLIFPLKRQAKGEIDRVSEQEFRFLFIEEFRKTYPALYYSVETPTVEKFCFRDTTEKEINKKQSALHDMCIFERGTIGKYHRILSIEFKHKNAAPKKIDKDICKLIAEDQDGVFIQLLNNTDSKTLCSVLNKLKQSFEKHQLDWKNEDKSIEIVIISLKQKTLIYRKLDKSDMKDLENIFLVESGCGNMNLFNRVGWNKKQLK